MEKQSLPVSEQISPEDWENTPTSVKRFVESLVANVSLSVSENRLIQFLDATPIGIAVHDSTGQLIYINNIGRSLLGTNRYSESETNRFSGFFQIYRTGTEEPYSIQDLPSSRAFAGETIQVSDLEIHRPDRVVPLEVSATPIFDQQGQVIYAITTFQDISDRKQAATLLEESEQRFRNLFESIPKISVQGYNRQRQVIYWNEASEHLYGYTKAEAIGKQLEDLIIPPEMRQGVIDAIQNWLINGQPIPADELNLMRKNGSRVAVYSSHVMLSNTEGEQELYCVDIDLSDRIQAQNQLKYEALHDALTGLPNRNLLIERLELSIHRIKRFENYHFAVLFLDLDRFKVINDSLGYLAGDKLLIAIAQKLQANLRDIDLIARLGGDEFVILLDEIKDIQEVIYATERIFAQLQTPLMIEGREVYTTSSIGIVLGTKDYTQASNLLRDADIAMYRAKTNGKARYEIFDVEMHREALIRMNLENDLRQAIAHQEFILHYQPIVDLNNGCLVGFEALMRWQHPSQGLKYPGEFIAVAEEIGLITTLTSCALRIACQQLAGWQTAFPDFSDLKVSVNLSAQDLRRSDLLAEVDLVLARTQLDARCLTLEITESMLIEDIESTIRLFSQLKERGIQISLDDFGTGYSSLNYLHRLPMNNLKVDRSFVNQIEEGKKNYQIVETIATLSKQLELEAIAEGIETLHQLEKLKELGYRFGQGYLFSKPLCPDSAEALLKKFNLSLFPQAPTPFPVNN